MIYELLIVCILLLIVLVLFTRRLHKRVRYLEQLLPKAEAPAYSAAPVAMFQARQLVSDALREHLQEKH